MDKKTALWGGLAALAILIAILVAVKSFGGGGGGDTSVGVADEAKKMTAAKDPSKAVPEAQHQELLSHARAMGGHNGQ